jgi:hypothetical protein
MLLVIASTRKEAKRTSHSKAHLLSMNLGDHAQETPPIRLHSADMKMPDLHRLKNLKTTMNNNKKKTHQILTYKT